MNLKTTIERLDLPQFEPPNPRVIDWLRSKKVDEVTIQELSSCSTCSHIKINQIYLNKFNDLIEENSDEQNELCLENGFLIIGSGLNGDPIVISIETKKIGYVCHDELWEDEECNFEDIVYVTRLNLSEFYESAQEKGFPVDIHDAEEEGI